MKTYKHLFEKLVSEDNIRLAIVKASKGKRKRERVKRIYEERDGQKWIDYYKNYAENFTVPEHFVKTMYDGVSKKKREITVPTFDEQVIHHMVVQVLHPIIRPPMYEHSYGSIEGRGTHLAKKQIEKWLRKDYKGTKYFLKMDVHHFYQSIPPDKLMDKFASIIKDADFLDLLNKVVHSSDNGLPLGFYTSQWFANFYMTDLDHCIKEKLGVKYYLRYMDDMLIYGSNKRKLHKTRKVIASELSALGIEMKSNWHIDRTDKTSLDFLGYKFHRGYTTLRSSIFLRIRRKAKKFKAKPSVYSARQIISYNGYLKSACVYNAYLKYIEPYASLKKARKIISNSDKERCKSCG